MSVTNLDIRVCPAAATHVIYGASGRSDDYTHACADHVESMLRSGDAVARLGARQAESEGLYCCYVLNDGGSS